MPDSSRTYRPFVYKAGFPASVHNLIAMDGRRFSLKGSAPPRYSTHGAGPSTSSGDNGTPPPYDLELLRFPVGGKVPIHPFVTPSQLKTHLGLLRAFKELKTRVTDLEASQDLREKVPALARGLGPEDRWTWFLELSLERSVLCYYWGWFC